MPYPAQDRSSTSVEMALRHFCGPERAVIWVCADRAPEIASAVRDAGHLLDPSQPHDPIHNSHVESATRTLRGGTRSLLLQSGLSLSHWPAAQRCFAYQFSATTLKEEPHRPAVREDCEADEPAVWTSRMHKALTYQPVTRFFPFGCLVWFKDRTQKSSFGPTGKPALYVEPEVLPALRHKDIHKLYDLALLKEGTVKVIVTRDFVAPSGKWVFPLSHVPMLKPKGDAIGEPPEAFDAPLPPPVEAPEDTRSDAKRRNRTITENRI